MHIIKDFKPDDPLPASASPHGSIDWAASEMLPEPVTEEAKGRPFLTRADFVDDFSRMKRGRRMIYHIGFLLHDRVFAIHARHIHAVGKHAWNLQYEGVAELTQQKIGPGVYYYFIQKRVVH